MTAVGYGDGQHARRDGWHKQPGPVTGDTARTPDQLAVPRRAARPGRPEARRASIAVAMAAHASELTATKLLRSFGGTSAVEQVALTTKGLAALNAIPQGLSATIGSTLATTASAGNWSGVADLVGGIIGGFTKSISG